jgi:hypothetical protein
MKPNPSLWTIKEHCSADWNQMRGDDRRRFCEHCRKFVHNVSAMSSAERAAFANPANQRECVFYSQRPDGGIADLSLLARFRRWFPFLRLVSWPWLVAILPATLSGCLMMGVRCQPGVTPIQPNTSPVSSPTTNQTTNAEPPK